MVANAIDFSVDRLCRSSHLSAYRKFVTILSYASYTMICDVAALFRLLFAFVAAFVLGFHWYVKHLLENKHSEFFERDERELA